MFGLLFYLSLIDDEEVAAYFQYVYVKYQKVMFHGAFSVLGDKQRAEDAVHDAFFRLVSDDERIKKILSLKHTEEEGHYLVTVCKHCATDILNSAASKHEETSDFDEDLNKKYYKHPEFSVEDIFEDDDADTETILREMVLALQKLRDDDRNLIIMLFYHNITPEEIIKENAWTRQIFYMRKSRALKRLRGFMKEIKEKGLFRNE